MVLLKKNVISIIFALAVMFGNVNATSDISSTRVDYDLITRTIMASAGNESYQSKIYVAAVIKNRMDKWGLTYDEVLIEGQFEKPFPMSWNREDYSNDYEFRMRQIQWQECMQAVYDVFFTDSGDYGGILYYRNADISCTTDEQEKWWNSLTKVYSEGGQIFYK